MIAAVESIVFLIQVNLDLMTESQCIFLSGGLSKLKILGQTLSSLSSLDVYVLDDAELSSRSALCAYLQKPSYLNYECLDKVEAKSFAGLQSRFESFKVALDKLV